MEDTSLPSDSSSPNQKTAIAAATSAYKLKWSVRLFVMGATLPAILFIPLDRLTAMERDDCWAFSILCAASCWLTALVLRTSERNIP